MPITYGDGGANRTPSTIYYQDGATRRTISEIWYGDGATKRQVYSSAAPTSANLTDHSIVASQPSTGSATASLTLSNGGAASGSVLPGGTGAGTYSGEWLVSGTAGDFEAMATLDSGFAPSSGTMDTWLSLGTSRTWSVTRNVAGSATSVFTLQIRNASSGAVLDSATITLQASKS